MLSYWREWVPQAASKAWWCAASRASPFKIKPHFTIDAVVIAYGTRITAGVRGARAEPGADSTTDTCSSSGRWEVDSRRRIG